MRRVIFTTSGRASDALIEATKKEAVSYGATYVDRKKRSVALLLKTYRCPIFIRGAHRLEYIEPQSLEPFFFHPDTAMFRIKGERKGMTDDLLAALRLNKGDRVLDCTLGRGSDSIVIAAAVGDRGEVVGVEKKHAIAYVVQEGLQTYVSSDEQVNEAMRRIKVVRKDAVDYLRKQPDCSFDVIYIDPMFEQTVEASSNFASLKKVATNDQLTEEWIQEAFRVARKRVVLKDHYRSTRFEYYGFHRLTRPSSKTHYGVLEKERE